MIAEGVVWVVSPREESALLTSSIPALRELEIMSVLDDRSTYVSSKRFMSALELVDLQVEDLMLANAMSGCAECPSTQSVPKRKYLKALLNSKDMFGPLSRQARPGSSEIYQRKWDHLEGFVATAFIESYGTSKGPPTKPNEILALRSTSRNDWAQKVRVWVAKSTEVLKPAMLMPEKADIKLQAMRELWLVEYWKTAQANTCNKSSAGGISLEHGYKNNGEPLLETEDEVFCRRKIMKKPVTTCSCQTGCLSRYCGCRKKDPPTLCVMCNCSAECQNRGGRSSSLIPVVNINEEVLVEGNDCDFIDYEPHSSDDDEGRYDSETDSVEETDC